LSEFVETCGDREASANLARGAIAVAILCHLCKFPARSIDAEHNSDATWGMADVSREKRDTPDESRIKSPFVRQLGIYILNTFVNKIPSHVLRLLIYRRFFEVGRDSAIYLNVRVRGSRIKIGDNVVVNSFASLDGRGATLSIGHGTDIGPFVRIWTLEHDPNSPTNATRAGAVIIGEDVWIGSGATVLPGVAIGDGAVVGSESVVTSNVPPRTVVAGNPARPINERKSVPYRSTKLRLWFE
jgi:maltose O-acetyltransferase